eukprot:1149387-Pelagomonas_calceolata.AAC.8
MAGPHTPMRLLGQPAAAAAAAAAEARVEWEAGAVRDTGGGRRGMLELPSSMPQRSMACSTVNSDSVAVLLAGLARCSSREGPGCWPASIITCSSASAAAVVWSVGVEGARVQWLLLSADFAANDDVAARGS